MSSRLVRDYRNQLMVLLIVLAIGLAANSILGPLAFEVIDYRYSDSLINQGIGLDAVALAAAAPAAVVAALLVRRQHRAGPFIAFIPAGFTAYMAPQYVIGPDYLGIDGNSERFFVFHLALFLVAAATGVVAWLQASLDPVRPSGAASDRRRALVLLAMVVFVLSRWIPALIELTETGSAGSDFEENPTAHQLIAFLDLGVIVPVALVAAFGLRRHRDWARLAAYAVIGWFALVPAAVAAMAIVMQVNDDPNASTGNTVLFVVAAVVFTVGAAWLYRPLFETHRSKRSPSRRSSHRPSRRRSDRNPPVRPRAAIK